ncbi:MAG: DUF4344 domain-containing metallopeptidase [Pseudolabrys sp.]|nr:DUF4344 domain-containing metallopeptidase [Pseudolabrys sp.]MDP2295871.1 DUF4344 domain-containing metallopeptidase [Pseudolabrys sp.]
MKTLVLAAVLIGLVVYSTPTLAQSTPSLRTDQVRVVYVPPKEPKHQPIHDALRERGILEMLRTLLSPLRLPRQLTLEVKGCDGQVDAYYGDDTVTVCYEYIELIQRHAPKVGTPSGLARTDAIVGAIIDTVLHEVGHAIFDMLDIPVLGREEDAADLFSAYILLQFAPDDARRLIQGVGFMMASEAKAALEEPTKLKTFSNEHGLPAQRYYNLLCMAYGSNPKIFGNMVLRGRLPKERADGCAEEYAMLRRAFQKLILPYVDVVLLSKALTQVRFNWGPLVPSTDGLDTPPLLRIEP